MLKRISIAISSIMLSCAAVASDRPLTEQEAAAGKIPIHDQGTAIRPQAQMHLDAAEKAAGTEFASALLLCNQARPPALQKKDILDVAALRHGSEPGQPTPVRVFDNLYYLGVGHATTWALTTPAGIIVIDAGDNGEQWRKTIDPGMRKLGLDPAQIKYVVITHGHGDHFGGAAYLAKTYNARIMMSDTDWALAPTMVNKPEYDAPPPRDRVIRDGDQLTLGGVTISLFITPGHTLGTVSLLIPVTDHGTAHVAALFGGNGFNFPHSTARFTQYSDSTQRFLKAALAAGANIPLSNHPENDRALEKIARLKQRGPNDPNPFVMGQDAVRRGLTALSECALAYRAQLSE